MLERQYIVRKFVMAKTAQEALKREGDIKPDEVWIDDEWAKNHPAVAQNSRIGYRTNKKTK